jgi:hypothetical protein
MITADQIATSGSGGDARADSKADGSLDEDEEDDIFTSLPASNKPPLGHHLICP